MIRTRCAALFLALLAAGGLAAEEGSYRLPEGIRPVSQLIELRVDPAQDSFSGRVEIALEVDAPVERIGLHQLGLEMTSIRLAGAGVTRDLGADAGGYDIHWLHDGEQIAAGTHELVIEFNGRFATDSMGMHRVEFEGNDYVFTQFEAMHARRAMPIFDEPIFKIPYRLTIVAPEGLTVVANTPVETRSVVDGWQRVEFRETKPMPSYLIAYAVGPLDRVPIEGMSVPGHIYTPKGRAGETGFVRREAPKILAWLEGYFGSDYPYAKNDFIAVPEFAFGAMENPGLITYRTDILLVGDDLRGRRAGAVLYTVAHELAHIWFGDLVTMKWWNDLWLNEAFASWVAKAAIEDAYPEYEYDLRLLQSYAFAADQRVNSTPIRQEVRTEREALVNVGINYTKGAALLRMLEKFVGREDWRDGVRNYITKFAWGNAEERDLWAAVAEVSGLDVTAMASPYLNQPGYAIVTVDADGSVSQQRYLAWGTRASELEWQVPMGIKYKHDGTVRETFYLLKDKTGRIDVPAGADWIFPQADANGYYRWQVDAAQFENLLDDLSELSDREKIVLLDNSGALVTAARVSMGVHLRVVDRMLDEQNPVVFQNAVDTLGKIGSTFIGPDNAALFGRYVDRRLAARLAAIGYDSRPGDSETMLQMRPALLRLLGEYGDDPKVHKAAEELAASYLDDPASVNPELATEALRVVALNDDGGRYDEYIKAYRDATVPHQKSVILSSIYFLDPDVVRRHLDFSISSEVAAGDSTTAIRLYTTILEDHTVLYDWLADNLEAYEAKMPSVRHVTLPQSMFGVCNEKNLALLKDFFAARDDKYAVSLARAVESFESCISSKQRDSAALNEFLLRNAG